MQSVQFDRIVEPVTMLPGHMDVKVVGSRAPHMVYSEVGLKGSENVQVGGPKQQGCNCALAARPIDLQLTQWLSNVYFPLSTSG